MRRTKRLNRQAVCVMSAALLLAQVPAVPVSAAGTAEADAPEAAAGEQTAPAAEEPAVSADIVIASADDLIRFAAQCRDQAYTQGKTVSLTADLDLTGTDFTPVPAFFGTFLGNGHTIRGFALPGAGADTGLFRCVEQGAVVQDLTVSGDLLPQGSREGIGGIAGINRGTIRNCTFEGSMEAKNRLGGIAGHNDETGVIEGCTNRASLTGNREVGGIAGKNEGTVAACVNAGEINLSPDGVTEDDGLVTDNISVSMDLDLDKQNLKNDLQTEKVNDVGGIAGYSSGTIRDCSNEGEVGYKSIGYNVGGIAGRHSGLIMGCKNSAAVAGRKDVGGIAGQQEPFLSVEYGNSTFDEVSDILDQMTGTRDALSDSVEGTGDHTTDSIDRMDDIMKQIRDLTRDKKAEQRQKRREYEDKANDELDKIDETLANMELDLGSDDADHAASKAKKNVSAIRKLLEKLGGGDDLILSEDDPAENLSTMLQYYSEIVTGLESNVTGLAENTDEMVTERINGIEDGIDDFANQLDDLRLASKDLLDDTRDYKDQLLEALDNVDDDVTAQLDRLYDELDDLSDTLKSDRDTLRSQKNRLFDEMDAMKSSVDDGKDRLRDQTDDLLDEDKDFFTDVSETTPAQTSGVTLSCSNSGDVTADYQAGGIVGTVGVEIGLDPDKDIEEYGDRTLFVNRYAAAYIQECRNDGTVFAQRDYVGGVAGAAWIGSLKDNQNYGDIGSEDGSYVGGIAGGSRAALTGSYSMCEVSGNDYVGGIAGSAKIARDNGTMATVVSVSEDNDSERLGSVIGGREDEDNADISGNFFVDDGALGAVDGVTYSAEASGLSYGDFTGRAGVPDEFRTLHVTFLADDAVVKELTCGYGESIPQAEIPQIPEKEGFHAAWETADLQSVCHNYKIRAVYTPWVNTISCSEDPKPELLAEAAFMPQATLTLTSYTEAEQAALTGAGSAKIVGAYHYEAADADNPSAPETVTLHALANGANAVGLVTENGIETVDAKQDGEYLVFSAAASGDYVLLSRVPASWLAAGAAAVLAAALVVFGRIRKKKREKAQETVAKDE